MKIPLNSMDGYDDHSEYEKQTLRNKFRHNLPMYVANKSD
jgi:hypothetical protein